MQKMKGSEREREFTAKKGDFFLWFDEDRKRKTLNRVQLCSSQCFFDEELCQFSKTGSDVPKHENASEN